MTYFLNPHFLFSMCDKHSVIISKVHNESIFLKNSSIIFNKILTQVYCNMDNEKTENCNVSYANLEEELEESEKAFENDEVMKI